MAPRLALAEGFADDERVQRFIEQLHREHAFARADLRAFFARLSYNGKVLALLGAAPAAGDAAAAPVKVYWQQYRRQRLTARKISAGIGFHRAQQAHLEAAQKKYGVPAAIITAIIGIETHYGRHTGKYPVGQTLATLAFGHPQRGAEFRQELAEFLLYARDARLDPLGVTGSYAGAIGMAQFMPSSLRRFAVDSDGDARINLFAAADAIASIGNFLRQHGWRPGIGTTYPARIGGAQAARLIADTRSNDYKPTMSYADLLGYGVQTAAPQGEEARYLFVDLENRYDTEYRVGTENFYTLTRYNKSFKYAAVVADLAREIQQRAA